MHEMLLASQLGAMLTALSDAIDAGTAPLSGSSTAALLTLLYSGPTPITELAGVLRLSQPATTRLVAKLVEQGLIDRVDTPGRAAPVSLSTEGETKARAVQQQRLDILAHSVASLDDADRTHLDRILSSLLNRTVTGRGHARQICRFCDHGLCDGPHCPVGSAARAVEPQGEDNASGT